MVEILQLVILLACSGQLAHCCPFLRSLQESVVDGNEGDSYARELQIADFYVDKVHNILEEVPTRAPTKKPKAQSAPAPTQLPATGNPSTVPTAGPTLSPSILFSKSPTFSPSEEPSASPTIVPTVQPTQAPTKSPTGQPTSEATVPGTATSFCVKTEYKTIVPTKVSICSAFLEVRTLLDANLPADDFARARLFGAAVRLAFHDAGEVSMTAQEDLLGPDGCMAQNGDSDGLTEATSLVNTFIEPLWQNVCDQITRADFWALFGKLVIEKAALLPVSVAYQYGRKDNVHCESGAGRLPSAQGGLEEIHRVFVDQMGLTINDAVTLLGAHSLGHMHQEVSGYGFTDPTADPTVLNAWDDTPAVLDNDYFIKLTDIGWKAEQTDGATKGQWRHLKDPWIMINPDMAIAYPISTDIPPLTRRQVCGPRTLVANSYGCRDPGSTTAPDTWDLCLQYAADNAAFLQAFAVAYTKMTTVGYGVPANVDGATATGKLGTLTTIDLDTCVA